MEKKTLGQLRALARAAGLRGFSELTKKQLIGLLKKQKAPRVAKSKKTATARKKVSPVAKPKPAVARKTAARPARVLSAAPARAPIDVAVPDVTIEEQIELAKYETAPRGVSFASSLPSTLFEDIDRLPPPREPVLCLLPQKPGVVHAYWFLLSGTPTERLRLRLCRIGYSAIELVDEIKVHGERGHYYFIVAQNEEPGDLTAQIGYYDPNGAFVTAIRRGVARIPSLYASVQTDRRWWINDEDFRAMYMRAGGLTRGARLFWPGATSSGELPAPITSAPSSTSLVR